MSPRGGRSHDTPAGARRTYFHLQVAAQRSRALADELFQDAVGLTTAQAAALSVIADAGRCSQRVVAETLRQRESAVTTMVRRLELAGFVERAVDMHDLRAWNLRPTGSGTAAVRGLEASRARLNRRIEAAVGVEAVDGFTDALEALAGLRTESRRRPESAEVR